jgi:hypothetical protein
VDGARRRTLLAAARVAHRLERAAELRNAALSEKALERAASGDAGALWLNLRGLFLPFAVTASICFACAILSPLFAIARGAFPPRLVSGLTGAWHAVWALAAACAIRAIRDPRAAVLAGIGFALVLVAAALLKALP